MHDNQPHRGRPLRIGSLFSGYGGLDLAVEYATGGETIWFSEINTPSIRVFASHWPGIPNLGDISTIDWATVPPVDVLIGGFPCQDVSTVGKGAGLAPGTRSGLWSHMVAAIDALQPKHVVIENVRGLLSAPAIRLAPEGAPPQCRQPRRCNQRSCNRRSQPGTRAVAAGRRANATSPGARSRTRRSGRPPTNCAMDRPTGVTGRCTASPVPGLHHRISPEHCSGRPWPRTPPRRRDPGPGTGTARHDRSESPSDRPRPERTAWLARQLERVGDPVRPDRDHLHRWGRYAHAIARWEHITGRAAPAPAILNEEKGPRSAPEFVE